MKILINLPLWPHLQIEGQPKEIAQLLNELKRGEPTRAESVIEPHLEELASSPNNKPSRPQQVKRRPSSPTTRESWPTNRREMVLMAMEALRDSGQDCPRIATIVAYCEKKYPEANSKHLDQVIRDLANKTDLVESPSRGSYRLATP